MSFQVQAEIDAGELRRLPGEVKKSMKDWKQGIFDEIKKECFIYAPKITRERLPSRGGSYLKRFGWRYIKRTNKLFVAEFVNRHQWAHSIETGQKRRIIESDNLMTAFPVLPTKAGGGNPPTRPKWGTGYAKGKAYRGYVFDWPGSRAFHIFRDTKKHMDEKIPKIINQVFRKIKK